MKKNFYHKKIIFFAIILLVIILYIFILIFKLCNYHSVDNIDINLNSENSFVLTNENGSKFYMSTSKDFANCYDIKIEKIKDID